MNKKLHKHLKKISKSGWAGKMHKYGEKKAREMMSAQAKKYWETHIVVHTEKPVKIG